LPFPILSDEKLPSRGRSSFRPRVVGMTLLKRMALVIDAAW